MRNLLLALCVLGLVWSSGAAAQSCSATASQVNFGSVSPISGAATSATGSVSVTCTWPPVSLTPNVLVCLNLNGTSPRSLAHGTDALQYDLYQNAAHTLAWGSSIAGTSPISLTLTKPALGTSATQVLTVFGQVAGNQPTVPTSANSSTLYTQDFSGTQTSVNYAYYLLGPPNCAALPPNGTFPFRVAATVVNNCNISATNLGFAPVGILGAALNASASIVAQCTNGDAYRIALSGGASGNVAARQMHRAGGGAVNYQLYLDAAHSAAWGDGSAGTAMATGLGSGLPQAIAVYGQVPQQATPAPGSYSDTITVTISF